jgi:dynamin family protein
MDKGESQNGGVEPPNGTTDNEQASQQQKPRFPTFRFPPDETKTKILKVLEKIRECNVNHEIDTPELVMCGKQSAGKSSVLEAITGLEFEKGDGGPCTRFVIEYVIFTALSLKTEGNGKQDSTFSRCQRGIHQE